MAAVARFLMTPNKDMNYAVVTVSYSIMLVIGIALLVAEKVFQVSVVAGFWIVPAPVVPCLLHALWMWRLQAAAAASEAAGSDEAKKDR